jgi:uncharacterized protein YecE (DUF72 family)
MSEKIIYERIHGKIIWYSHNYTDNELKEIKDRIMSNNSTIAYVFFNNNHAMLENARTMFNILKPISEVRNK